MNHSESPEVVQRTQDYYDSDSADRFYASIWGGNDIHIGIYENPEEPIAPASRRTVERMAARLPQPGRQMRVLDIGAGYGGSARHLVQTWSCPVTCLNLSAVQNERNRQLNRQGGLTEFIDVIDGSFEDLPFADAAYDVVWSQDALLHSGRRARVLEEVNRVLRPGGSFLFTDPMQADDCPPESLGPVLRRIHLESLGSPGFYRAAAQKLGWTEQTWEDLSPHLAAHYARVLGEVERRGPELCEACGAEYVANMQTGLRHWIDAGQAGRLCWGIFHFQKPAGNGAAA